MEFIFILRRKMFLRFLENHPLAIAYLQNHTNSLPAMLPHPLTSVVGSVNIKLCSIKAAQDIVD
jgi:hypothetical protein